MFQLCLNIKIGWNLLFQMHLGLIFIMLLLLIMVTSALGLSKLWSGGIPTSDIAHSAPRLRCLLLIFNLALWPTFFFSRFLYHSAYFYVLGHLQTIKFVFQLKVKILTN